MIIFLLGLGTALVNIHPNVRTASVVARCTSVGIWPTISEAFSHLKLWNRRCWPIPSPPRLFWWQWNFFFVQTHHFSLSRQAFTAAPTTFWWKEFGFCLVRGKPGQNIRARSQSGELTLSRLSSATYSPSGGECCILGTTLRLKELHLEYGNPVFWLKSRGVPNTKAAEVASLFEEYGDGRSLLKKARLLFV